MYTNKLNTMRLPELNLSSSRLPGVPESEDCVGGGDIVISMRVQEAYAADPRVAIDAPCNRFRRDELPGNTQPYGSESYVSYDESKS